MFVNFMAREVDAKLAFLGPTGSGRRTAMFHFQKYAPPRGKVNWTDSAQAALDAGELWFDFLPPTPVVIEGFGLRLHLHTPGNRLLDGAAMASMAKAIDAIVFVADSQRARQSANVEAMRLLAADPALAEAPMALLYNKRDLGDIASAEEMNAALNTRGLPFFEGVATELVGVAEALEAALVPAVRRHRERVAKR